MKNSVRFWVFSLVVVLSLALAACGGQQSAAPKAPAASGGAAAPAATGAKIDLGIKGEELAFDKDKIEVTAAKGEKITLKFTNTSQTQEHNFILLNHNDMAKATTFNDVAMAAVDTGYYPEDDAAATTDVIAHIPALKAGESKEITFDSPGPGSYIYLCAVAGHFAAGDHGVLTIK